MITPLHCVIQLFLSTLTGLLCKHVLRVAFVYRTGPARGSGPAAHLHLRVPRGQERSTVRQAGQVQDAAGLSQELRFRQVRPAPQDLENLHGQFSCRPLILFPKEFNSTDFGPFVLQNIGRFNQAQIISCIA